MNGNAAFDEAYAKLNAEQRQAVDTIEGPVFVIAGPGTGKTQVLTLRIANILRQTDTPPDAILALTFTEAAAREMRERLRRIIGPQAAKLRIHTFHGFAESVISRFPDEFPRIIGSQVASDIERAELMDSVLLGTPTKHMRPFGDPLYYHAPAIRAIAALKRENVTPEALEERLRQERDAFDGVEGKVHETGKYAGQMKGAYQTLQKKLERTEDLLAVYRAYEAALTAAKRYDYEDLILEVVRALDENEPFRLQVQESLLYVLADEHQDANRAQNALLELVSGFHERPNLFIVGDEKQAIYRFQGADLDNVQYFRTKFEGTTILTLVENYRSTQTILDTALSLVSASPDERLSRAPLVANADAPAKPISVVACGSFEEEMAALAANIKKALDAGTEAGDIAVLVRRNKDIPDVARALARAGIRTAGAGNDDALANRFALALLRLLAAVADPRDEMLAGVLMLPGFGLPAADVARLTQYARQERAPLRSLFDDERALSASGIRSIEEARAFGARLSSWARLASYDTPAAVAQEALIHSGLLARALAAPDRADALSALRGLMNALDDISRREHGALLPRALELVALYQERHIELPGSGGAEDTLHVKVMTVHRAKGREFAQVFLPLLTANVWSSRARAEYFHLPDILSGGNELEDERRLLYVGITRAKRHATLSYASASVDGRPQEPSELLDDLAPELVQRESPAEAGSAWLESAAEAATAPASQGGERSEPSADDLATLRATFFAQGLSPTSLNNYLDCPWHYFYVNLLRIPETKGKHAEYGTAVHAALKRYSDARTNGTDIGTQGLITSFLSELSRSTLSTRELEEMQEKGERALAAWWEQRHDAWPDGARAEVPLRAELPLADETRSPHGGEHSADGTETLPLRGKLDRIDAASGGVRVVDYKTSKPRTRNELMGATKNANGDYYRQLTFYKLLLARSEEAPETMMEGSIEFIEPDDKGRIKTESFAIADEEVAELEALIQKSAQEILALSFWNDPCEKEECEWCAIRFSL